MLLRFLVLLLIALARDGLTQATTGPDMPAALRQAVDAAHRQGEFDGVVVVTQHGRTLFSYAVGEADHATRQRISPSSVFRLASLTKQVTALLIMQQVERGKLRLDEPASEVLPQLSAGTGRVTVRQLLQHISGIPNPTSGPDDRVPAFYTAASVGADYLQTTATGFCSGAPVREPDQKFEYNNCDYIVLGALLEKSTGMGFADLIRTRIAQPLGLTSWGVYMGTGTNPVAVKGYDAAGKPEFSQNPATYGSAGALYGNALDVARWSTALLQHELLSAASTAILFHGEANLGGEALGSWSYDLPGTNPTVHLWERQGDIGGTRVLSLVLPDADASIAIVANTERADLFNTYSKRGLGFALVKVLTGR